MSGKIFLKREKQTFLKILILCQFDVSDVWPRLQILDRRRFRTKSAFRRLCFAVNEILGTLIRHDLFLISIFVV